MMGEDFMMKELNSQNPRDCILQGMQPYQASSPAEEQARQRALSQQPSALKVNPMNFTSCLLEEPLQDQAHMSLVSQYVSTTKPHLAFDALCPSYQNCEYLKLLLHSNVVWY